MSIKLKLETDDAFFNTVDISQLHPLEDNFNVSSLSRHNFYEKINYSQITETNFPLSFEYYKSREDSNDTITYKSTDFSQSVLLSKQSNLSKLYFNKKLYDRDLLNLLREVNDASDRIFPFCNTISFNARYGINRENQSNMSLTENFSLNQISDKIYEIFFKLYDATTQSTISIGDNQFFYKEIVSSSLFNALLQLVTPNFISSFGGLLWDFFYPKVIQQNNSEFSVYDTSFQSKKNNKFICESETVGYKLEVIYSSTVIQTMYFPIHRSINLKDFFYTNTNLIPDKDYKYKLTLLVAVFGHRKNSTNTTHTFSRPLFVTEIPLNEINFKIGAEQDKNVYNDIEKIYPPITPNFNIIPFAGVSNRIRLDIRYNIGTKKAPFFTINNDEASYLSSLRTEQNAIERIDFTGDPQDYIYFQSTDPPQKVQIFRTDTIPTKYSDFHGKMISEVDFVQDITADYNRYSSVIYDDSIIENKTYYYTIRSVNKIDTADTRKTFFSNPTEVYMVRMNNESGVIYPDIRVLDTVYKKKDNVTIVSIVDKIKQDSTVEISKKMKRYLHIKPALSQILFRDEINNNVSQLSSLKIGSDGNGNVWDKLFKIRLTSKVSGKKIDFNVKFVKKDNP